MTAHPTCEYSGACTFPVPLADARPPQPATLNVTQAAIYLGISESILNTWRTQDKGPRHVRLGRKVLYRIAALDDYLLSHERGGRG